jgi:serine/threonine protein phosphatase PrpC
MRKHTEIYGISKPQDGRKSNEDAFAIIRIEIPVIVVCDGAGNAEQSAKKVIRTFQGLIQKAVSQDFMSFQNWKTWAGFLDASLMGGHQSTFTALAILDDRIVGVNVGDGKVFKFCSDGSLTTLSHGSSKKRLGSNEIEPFPIHVSMQNREIVAVLSDGAWTPLSQHKISTLFRQRLSIHPADLPEKFLQEAGRHGRSDDMTAVLAYF